MSSPRERLINAVRRAIEDAVIDGMDPADIEAGVLTLVGGKAINRAAAFMAEHYQIDTDDQYPILKCVYRCMSCDNTREIHTEDNGPPDVNRDSKCCTYGRWLLQSFVRVKNPGWNLIKECYGGS